MAHKRLFKCNVCFRSFRTPHSLSQHIRDAHTKLADIPDIGKGGARAVLDGMEDLPDGAYLAMADDLGLDVDDLI